MNQLTVRPTAELGYVDFTHVLPAYKKTRHVLFVELVQLAFDKLELAPTITADDLRFVGIDCDRRIVGTVLMWMLKERMIEKVTYVKTTVRRSHSRPILQFRLVGYE